MSKSYRIQIDETSYEVDDPVIAGLQLLDTAGKRPSDEYLIFQRLQNGQLEEIRPDETVDLRKPGIEAFITWQSDRSFRFVIDGRKFEWGIPLITGLKLKQLAGVDPNLMEFGWRYGTEKTARLEMRSRSISKLPESSASSPVRRLRRRVNP
jgi:hypothetical protein